MSHQTRSITIAASGELIGLVALLAGGVAGHLIGGTLGLLVGLALGFAILLTSLWAVVTTEKNSLVCECSLCHKHFPYRQCTRRSANAG